MLSSLAFVRAGSAAAIPQRFEPTDEQMGVLKAMRDEAGVTAAALARREKRDKKETNADADADAGGSDAEFDAKFKMDDYDDSDDEEQLDSIFGTGLLEQIQGLNVDGQADGENPDFIEGDDLSDVEDMAIRPSDCLLIGAHAEEDVSHLDVYVYEAENDNLYVHHDLLLPSYPLAVEWLDYRPGNAATQTEYQRQTDAANFAAGVVDTDRLGNFVAVASYLAGIEIWDLDVMDVLEPVSILGGEVSADEAPKAKKGKKGRRNRPTVREGSHSGPVLCLSWNRIHRNILASGGADGCVKVWDLATGGCAYTLRHHSKEVQAVAWHPISSTVLATGSYDKTVCIVDGSAPQNSPVKFGVPSDVESISWDPSAPSRLLVACDDGHVLCFETGVGVEGGAPSTTPLWTLGGHHKAVSGVAPHPAIPGLIATVSQDKSFKLWDVSSGTPMQLFSKEYRMPFFSAAWAVEADLSVDLGEPKSWTLALGGASDSESNAVDRLVIVDIRELADQVQLYADNVIAAISANLQQQ